MEEVKELTQEEIDALVAELSEETFQDNIGKGEE